MAHDWRAFLRAEMDRQGLNPKQVSLAIGKGETYVRDIMDGKKGNPPSEPGAENLAKIARVLGMTLQKLYTGEEPDIQRITIIGSVANDEHWSPITGKKGDRPQDIEFRVEGGEPVALEVRGVGLASSGYRHGDLLIGAKRVGAHADNLINMECIIMTERDDRYVMYLERGNVAGTYNLRPHHPGDRTILNVRIKWAAPVMWIKRAQH